MPPHPPRSWRLCSLGYWQSLHGEPEDATTPLVFWAFLLFLALNLVTKGALASAEASLAPQYEAAAKAAAAGGEPPAQETLVDRTATFALYLGLVGLVSYLLMALKPTRKPASPAAPSAASLGGAAAPLLPQKEPAAQAAEETESLSDAPTLAARIAAWMSAHADELDVLLLMVSLALTLAGGVLVAPLDWSGASGLREVAVGLDRLTAGMAMLWSLGAPICDVLAVSMFSVIYSSVRPGSSQAAYMVRVLVERGARGRVRARTHVYRQACVRQLTPSPRCNSPARPFHPSLLPRVTPPRRAASAAFCTRRPSACSASRATCCSWPQRARPACSRASPSLCATRGCPARAWCAQRAAARREVTRAQLD
jgi:hypothetical protein